MVREQVIQRMQQAHRHLLQEVWEHRMADLPVRTPEQLVILASIVEKETGKADERSRVASVFVNRLKNKMRLQSDPTIIYGLTGGKGSLGRPILKSEIDQPTPYNTYVIDGLPPGPIANPGRASLEAAANPARTKDLYFVADGTGGHVFSENYEAASEERGAPARDREDRHARAGKAVVPCERQASRLSSPALFFPQLNQHEINPGWPWSSMTGFARGHGVAGAYAWSWELKSVNAKGLDLRLRLPPGWDAIEVPARARAAEKLTAGPPMPISPSSAKAWRQHRSRSTGAGSSTPCWRR